MTRAHSRRIARAAVAAAGLVFVAASPPPRAAAQHGHEPHAHGGSKPAAAPGTPLPALPENLPGWLDNTRKNHIYRKRGPYNDAIYDVRPLALDLNAVAVGHAMAYEDLVTGKAAGLETDTYARILRVLKNPPRFMPDEAAISPTFNRRYGVLEQVFDWTHVLHAQTIDVLASTKLSPEAKDAEIDRLVRFYEESVPYAVTGLPMNMEFLDGQPYSGAFRRKYPKVNGLFWGYHWLQGAMYDALYRKTLGQQRAVYTEVIGPRYHETELYKTDRPFMPMFAEVSPVFAARFPRLANIFDNLHMLHDLVNDILATEGMTEAQKGQQIKRAIWMVSAAAHRGEKPGDGKAGGGLHDHRHMDGMPGMGMMKHATEKLMFMPGMGWMGMDACHHCSMPLPGGADAWRASSVSAEGWTMRVRCVLCARDMAAETKGRTLLTLATEDPNRPLVLVGDDEGNLVAAGGALAGAVFLEDEGSHAGCDDWSRVFTSRSAFDAYVRSNPEHRDAKPLTLAEWSERHGKKPDTYYKPKGPVEDPYAPAKAGSEDPT